MFKKLEGRTMLLFGRNKMNINWLPIVGCLVFLLSLTACGSQDPYAEYPDYFRSIVQQLEEQQGPVWQMEQSVTRLEPSFAEKPDNIEEGYAYPVMDPSSENQYVFGMDWLKLSDGRILENIAVDLSEHQLAGSLFLEPDWDLGYWLLDSIFYDREEDRIYLTFDIPTYGMKEYPETGWLLVDFTPDMPQDYRVTELTGVYGDWFTSAYCVGDTIYDGSGHLDWGNVVAVNRITHETHDCSAEMAAAKDILSVFAEEYKASGHSISAWLFYAVAEIEDVTVYVGWVQETEATEPLMSVYVAYQNDSLVGIMTVNEETGEIQVK